MEAKQFLESLKIHHQVDKGNYSYYKVNNNVIEIDYICGTWVKAFLHLDKINWDLNPTLSEIFDTLTWK